MAGWNFWELKRGTIGRSVLDVQVELSEVGAYSGTLHGSFDADLERAITRFQKSHGIYPNGVWNKQTMTKVQEIKKQLAKLGQGSAAALPISDTKKTNGDLTPNKGEHHGE